MKKALAILLFFGIFFGAGLLAGGNAQASKLSNFLNSLGQQQSEQDQGDVAEQQSDEGYQVVEQPAEREVVVEQPVVVERRVVIERIFPAQPAMRQPRPATAPAKNCPRNKPDC